MRFALAAALLAGCAHSPRGRPIHKAPAAVRASAAPAPPAARRPVPPAVRVSDSIVQIGIVRQMGKVVLRPEGRFSAVDQLTGETFQLESSADYLLLAGGGRSLELGSHHFEGQFRLIPADADGYVKVGPKKYRGSLLIKSVTSATFTIVDELGIEEYLEGVLPGEMSPDWPPEALKAQAVVARTFALANLDKFRSQGFDLSDDTRSQAYADLDKQTERTAKAVRETQGQVLRFNGALLRAFFHSCCGGHTGSVGTIWGEVSKAPAPLRGVADRFCRLSPQYEWSAYFTGEDIAAALQRHGFPLSKVQAIRMGQYDRSSGYVKTLKFKANGRWLEIRANDFRNWIGNKDFKSTKIYRITSKSRGWLFAGRGFGHGVGLCQWGAKAMAEKGRDYRSILRFYFPGAKVETRED